MPRHNPQRQLHAVMLNQEDKMLPQNMILRDNRQSQGGNQTELATQLLN